MAFNLFGNDQSVEAQKRTIQELRSRTKSAGLYFPDSPVTLQDAMKFAAPALEGDKSNVQVQQQTDQFLGAPSMPLEQADLIRAVMQGAKLGNAPMSPEQIEALMQSVNSNPGGVGGRSPITEKPSLLSVAPPPVLLNSDERLQFLQDAYLSPQARERQQAQKELELLQKVTGNIKPEGPLFETAFGKPGVIPAEKPEKPSKTEMGSIIERADELGLEGQERYEFIKNERAAFAGQTTAAREREKRRFRSTLTPSVKTELRAMGVTDPESATPEQIDKAQDTAFERIQKEFEARQNIALAGKEKVDIADEARKVYADLESADDLIDQIQFYSEKVNTFGPGERVTGFLEREAGALTQSNKDAARFKQQGGLLANIARSLGGERGVLTDQDVARANMLVPSINDTKEIAEDKIRELREIIKNGRKRAIERFQRGAFPQQTPPGFQKEEEAISLDEYLKGKGQ